MSQLAYALAKEIAELPVHTRITLLESLAARRRLIIEKAIAARAMEDRSNA